MQQHRSKQAISGLLILALALGGCGGGGAIRGGVAGAVPQAAPNSISPSSDLAKAIGNMSLVQQIVTLPPGQILALPGVGPWMSPPSRGIQPQCIIYLNTSRRPSSLRRPQCLSSGYQTYWETQDNTTSKTTLSTSESAFPGTTYDASTGAQQSTDTGTTSGTQITAASGTINGVTTTYDAPPNSNFVPGNNTLPNGLVVNIDATTNIATTQITMSDGTLVQIRAAPASNGADADVTVNASNGFSATYVVHDLDGGSQLVAGDPVAHLAYDPFSLNDGSPIQIAGWVTWGGVQNAQLVGMLGQLVLIGCAASGGCLAGLVIAAGAATLYDMWMQWEWDQQHPQ